MNPGESPNRTRDKPGYRASHFRLSTNRRTPIHLKLSTAKEYSGLRYAVGDRLEIRLRGGAFLQPVEIRGQPGVISERQVSAEIGETIADHDVRGGEALAQQGSSFSQVAIEGRQQPLDLRSRFG